MVLHLFHVFENSYFKYHEFNELKMKLKNKTDLIRRIEKFLRNYRIKLNLIGFKKGKETITLTYSVQLPRTIEKELISKSLLELPDVYYLKWID
jgi:hypothetical protein